MLFAFCHCKCRLLYIFTIKYLITVFTVYLPYRYAIVMLTKGPVEEVEEFTYLGSVVSTTGGTDQDVEARLGKARVAFRAMDKLWTSQVFGRATKAKIFNSNVKAVLVYASEFWTVTQRQ